MEDIPICHITTASTSQIAKRIRGVMLVMIAFQQYHFVHVSPFQVNNIHQIVKNTLWRIFFSSIVIRIKVIAQKDNLVNIFNISADRLLPEGFTMNIRNY